MHPFHVSDQMVDEILTTALEGGINYWAVKATPSHWPSGPSTLFPGDQDVFASEVLTKGADLIITVDGEDATQTLTLRKMKAGIREAAKLRKMTVEEFHENHDAGDADLAVQFAVFGEAVYG